MASSLLWAEGRRRQTPQCRFVIFAVIINIIIVIIIIVLTIIEIIMMIMTMQPTFIAPWSKSKEIKRARRLEIIMLITMMLMMNVIKHQDGDDECQDSEDHHDVK